MFVIAGKVINLGLVIDISKTMKLELQSIQKAFGSLLKSAARSHVRKVKSVVITSFDKEIKIRSYSNASTAMKKLQELKSGKSASCRRPSGVALFLTLKRAKRYSIVFLFTNAKPKSQKYLNLAIRLAKKKHIRIISVITSGCTYAVKSAYRTLARKTNGVYYFVRRTRVSEVCERASCKSVC